MNISLVGDFSAALDEGFKNTGHYLARELETTHSVTKVNVKQIKTLGFWRELTKSRADVIHTIAQPTHHSFAFTQLLKRRWPHAPTVISALRPERYFRQGQVTSYQRHLIRTTQPDLVLVQSSEAERLFGSLGCAVGRLPNGVDLTKFRPASLDHKQELRRKYGLDPLKPVALHVGHLEPDRNLLALADLPPAGIQVVVAGSLYMGTHHKLIRQLEVAGYHLFKGYQADIAELYRLADLYVFPPVPGNSLAMPLSVLEAMACNLPVITTRFSGLEEAFGEGYGLKFVGPNEPFLPQVEAVLAASEPCETRRTVETFSWSGIARTLTAHYQELLKP